MKMLEYNAKTSATKKTEHSQYKKHIATVKQTPVPVLGALGLVVFILIIQLSGYLQRVGDNNKYISLLFYLMYGVLGFAAVKFLFSASKGSTLEVYELGAEIFLKKQVVLSEFYDDLTMTKLPSYTIANGNYSFSSGGEAVEFLVPEITKDNRKILLEMEKLVGGESLE